MSSLSEIISREFSRQKIVIVGDLVADQFLSGTISRVSREAPVFILRHEETQTLAGGAANAAVNVAALSGRASLVGLVGMDENGKALTEALKSAGVDCGRLVHSDEFRTTTKVRVLAGQEYAPRQQVIRIDYENEPEISRESARELRENLSAAAQDADAFIISDYNYGVAGKEIMDTAREIANGRKIPLLIDSRFRLRNFPNATTATPNSEEVEAMLGKGFTDQDCEKFCRDLGYRSLLVTCGNQGMILVEPGREAVRFKAIGSTEPVDVTGAGDTVIAAYALGLAAGLTFAESANIANHAGGIVVMKKRTASATLDELVGSLNENFRESTAR